MEKECCGGDCGCGENDECCGCDEVEEIEFNLSDSEIDEWINELSRLKEEKATVILEIDDSLGLKINYSEEEVEEE